MELRRNFSFNLIFLVGLNLLIKPIYLFGIEVGVQNSVGADEYGLYYAMFNFTFLFNVLLDLGINNYQKIEVAKDTDRGMQNMATLLPLKILLSVVYMLTTVAVAWLIGFEGRYWFFIGWLMINHVLSVFLLLLRANLSGMHLFIRDSILSVTDRLLMIITIGYLLWFSNSDFQIETFVVFQTASYAFAIVLALLLTPKGQRLITPHFNYSNLLLMARQTWPFALLILLMTAYNKLDGIMLERLSDRGTLEAGIYAQAFRILDAGNSFAFLYAGLLLPMFARLLGQPDSKPQINELVDRAARMLIIPAGVVCTITSVHSHWIMDLLYLNHAEESALSLNWLMGSFVFLACGYVFGTLITASTKMKLLNWIALGTVALNVVLNVIMIPIWGAEGAAMSSFISLMFMAVSQVVYATIQYDLKLFSWLLRGIAIWSLTLACLYGSSFVFDAIALRIGMTVALTACAYLLFVLSPRTLLQQRV